MARRWPSGTTRTRRHPPTLALEGDLDSADDSDLDFKAACKQLVQWRESTEFDLITVLDAEYPVALRGIHQMPPLLFVKGQLRSDEVGVWVVGSRKPTQRGLSVAAHVAEGWAARGISVISGLAEGLRIPRSDGERLSKLRARATRCAPDCGARTTAPTCFGVRITMEVFTEIKGLRTWCLGGADTAVELRHRVGSPHAFRNQPARRMHRHRVPAGQLDDGGYVGLTDSAHTISSTPS